MIKDVEQLRKICLLNSEISADLIDTKLMYYADEKEKLGKQIIQKLKKYEHITCEWPKSYVNFIISQLIVHRIFKENGLIHKYMNHAFVKALPREHQIFLKVQQDTPWRYTFSSIISTPHPDFYEMEDVFTEQKYLLYSPSIGKTLKENNPTMWLLLIGFNGHCWQSFGLNIPLINVDPDDVFYFSTELNPLVEDEYDIIEDLDVNPLPYIMMLDLGVAPKIVHKKHQLSYWISQNLFVTKKFDTAILKNNFFTSWNNNVYQLKLKRYNSFPHYAIAYYDEATHTICRSAFTELGFTKLTNALNQSGFDVSDEADVHLSFAMHDLLESVLKKEIIMNPYESLFEMDDETDEDSIDESSQVDALTKFMDIAFSNYNNNLPVDVEKIATEVGADSKIAQTIWENFQKTIHDI